MSNTIYQTTPEDLKLHNNLKNKTAELVKQHNFIFGLQNDVNIINLLNKITKSNKTKETIIFYTKVIYLLKK